MDKTILNSGLITTEAGDVTVHNYDDEIRECTSTPSEYLTVGVSTLAYSCLGASGIHKAGYAICRSVNLNSRKYVSDHRGEIVCNTETGELKQITTPGDYPENIATIAPSTSRNKWNSREWVTSIEAQYSAAVDTAEAQRQSLIDTVMTSIGPVQLKLQIGRKLMQAETTRLNAALDYIDAVTATNTSTTPDVTWSELPEVQATQYLAHRRYRSVPMRPDNPTTNYIVPVPRLSDDQ